jgi:hypothetical protein
VEKKENVRPHVIVSLAAKLLGRVAEKQKPSIAKHLTRKMNREDDATGARDVQTPASGEHDAVRLELLFLVACKRR